MLGWGGNAVPPPPSRNRQANAETPMLRSVLLALLLVLPAAEAVAVSPLTLRLIESVRIRDKGEKFEEPSGLALSADRTHLWSVSDDAKRVHRLGFDGEVKAEKAHAPVDGFEGVAVLPDGRLLLVREEHAELLTYDPAAGAFGERLPLSALEGWGAVEAAMQAGSGNDGLEGVVHDPVRDRILLIKEAAPRMILVLSTDLTRIVEHRELDRVPGFEARGGERLDVSGIAYDARRDLFWIVSDRGRRLHLYSWELGAATFVDLVDLDGDPIDNAEGVAIDVEAGRLWIVTDDGKKSRLHTYAVE